MGLVRVYLSVLYRASLAVSCNKRAFTPVVLLLPQVFSIFGDKLPQVLTAFASSWDRSRTVEVGLLYSHRFCSVGGTLFYFCFCFSFCFCPCTTRPFQFEARKRRCRRRPRKLQHTLTALAGEDTAYHTGYCSPLSKKRHACRSSLSSRVRVSAKERRSRAPPGECTYCTSTCTGPTGQDRTG